jgi:hypothetical protein
MARLGDSVTHLFPRFARIDVLTFRTTLGLFSAKLNKEKNKGWPGLVDFFANILGTVSCHIGNSLGICQY